MPNSSLDAAPEVVARRVDPVAVAADARNLMRAAAILESVIFLAGGSALIAGVILALQRTSAFSGTTIHPYLGLGIGIAAGGGLTALFWWAIARTMRVIAGYIHVEVQDRPPEP